MSAIKLHKRWLELFRKEMKSNDYNPEEPTRIPFSRDKVNRSRLKKNKAIEASFITAIKKINKVDIEKVDAKLLQDPILKMYQKFYQKLQSVNADLEGMIWLYEHRSPAQLGKGPENIVPDYIAEYILAALEIHKASEEGRKLLYKYFRNEFVSDLRKRYPLNYDGSDNEKIKSLIALLTARKGAASDPSIGWRNQVSQTLKRNLKRMSNPEKSQLKITEIINEITS